MKTCLLLLLLLAADPWAEGVRAYRSGQWQLAWTHFEAAAAAQAQPSAALMWNQAMTALQLQRWADCERLARAAAAAGEAETGSARAVDRERRRDALLAELSWRQCAAEVHKLAPSKISLEQVGAQQARALQSALRRAQRAQALWGNLAAEVETANAVVNNSSAQAAARRNQKIAAVKVEQLQQTLQSWQQQLAKKDGKEPPQQNPDQIKPDAPPPPPEQPKMTMQDQQDLLDKLNNRQKKKVVVRERNAGKAQPGGKDW